MHAFGQMLIGEKTLAGPLTASVAFSHALAKLPELQQALEVGCQNWPTLILLPRWLAEAALSSPLTGLDPCPTV